MHQEIKIGIVAHWYVCWHVWYVTPHSTFRKNNTFFVTCTWTLVHVILNSIRVYIYLDILFKNYLSTLRGKSNDLSKRIPLALDSTETRYKAQVHYIPIFGNEMMLTYTRNTMTVLGLAQKSKIHFALLCTHCYASNFFKW